MLNSVVSFLCKRFMLKFLAGHNFFFRLDNDHLFFIFLRCHLFFGFARQHMVFGFRVVCVNHLSVGSFLNLGSLLSRSIYDLSRARVDEFRRLAAVGVIFI